MNKIGKYSTLKSSKGIAPSFQTLANNIKAVVFEKDKMEHRDWSILKALLPLMAHQPYIYGVEKNLHDILT